MPSFLDRHKVVRRTALVWACVIITLTVLRVTEPEVITVIGPAGATVVGAIIGILTPVIMLYQNSRHKEDQR